jgi:UTP--glucose-1-phosphate uridylyltransferase
VRQVLERYHFDRDRLRAQATALARGEHAENRVAGRVTPPEPGDVVSLPAPDTAEARRFAEIGRDAFRRGECALVVLAGGMATRMGGVVKALVEALPGHSFLELRLREVAAIERVAEQTPPLWLMSSYATDEKLRSALGARLDGERVAVFPQHLSLRLTPDGHVWKDAQGRPSLYACTRPATATSFPRSRKAACSRGSWNGVGAR